MDQKKTGQFLKTLRNEKGLTQEQLAKHFNVSNRSVSRWETGSNLPDISLLVEIADFYDVDVREIIDGERKSEMMDNETREVAGKMAAYAGNEKGALLRFVQIAGIAGIFISLLSLILQTVSYQPDLRRSGAILATFLAFIVTCVITLYVTGTFHLACGGSNTICSISGVPSTFSGNDVILKSFVATSGSSPTT